MCFDQGVPIKTSSGLEIEALLANLHADDLHTREAAVARLTVIGTRTVERLVKLIGSKAPAVARAAAIRVLEGIDHPRALDSILAGFEDPDREVKTAAVVASAAFLQSARSLEVLDRLTAVALDEDCEQDVRLAAMEALAGLKSDTLEPLWTRLAADSLPAVRSRALARAAHSPVQGPTRTLAAACEGNLPDAEALQQAIVEGGSALALPMLHRLIERIREREASSREPRRMGWTRARAAAHLALAQRGSRLALYDLREALEAATTPLPVEFLTALSRIGDASCIEPIAAAYARSVRAGVPANDWWRQHLAGAFRGIVEKERLTKKHAVMKKVVKRWGPAVDDLVDRSPSPSRVHQPRLPHRS